MKRMDLIAMLFAVTLISCSGQTNKKSEPDKNVAKPQENIKVNKQYDSNGNLIKYDSTYSSYYSNIKDNKNKSDSIFNSFKDQFNKKYFFSNNPYFNDFFFQDSLLKYDFYKKDFFLNRFRNNMHKMDSLFWGMDSLKNNFFGKQFMVPGPLTVPKNK
jgi:hypothetical protein